jgi:hypothetical protein
MRSVSLLAAASAALVSSCGAVPSASVIGYPQFVYNFETEHCPKLPQPGCDLSINPGCDADVPDAPLRAWYGSDGNVGVLASVDLGSRGLYGPTISTIRHSCELYANSTNDPVWPDYASHEWVHSLVAFPENNTIYALTHMEIHCEEPPAPYCPYLGKDYSFFTAITLFVSVDGGKSFQHARPPPNHLVAASPIRWNTSLGEAQKSYGFRSPSGIVATPTGWYYATVTAGWGFNYLGQQAGACMMRTRDITDPASWRAWNGSAFSVILSADPYTDPNIDPAAHRCVPFTNMTYASLVYSTFYKRFMLFGTNDGDDNGGWEFALTDDFINWDSWTMLQLNGYLDGMGNATITPPPANTTLPGRFIKVATSDGVFWEDPTSTYKRPVGSCTPCPQINACSSVVTVPQSVFDGLVNRSGLTCGLLYNTSGYTAYYYPTLIDGSVALTNPSFDAVGQSATLFVVAQRCVNAYYDAPSGQMKCSGFNPDGILYRDILSIPVVFTGGPNEDGEEDGPVGVAVASSSSSNN